MERNTSVGNKPFCSASQAAFSTFSDQLLESANLILVANCKTERHSELPTSKFKRDFWFRHQYQTCV